MPSERPGVCGLVALALAGATGCTDTPYDELVVDMTPGPPPATVAPSRPVLRFSVATIQSPADTFASYSRLFQRMGELLGEEVRFVQRRTYAEVNDLLLSGQLDAALVCTGGFLDIQGRAQGLVELLAVPVIDGKTTYHSLVIVPSASAVRSVEELAGLRFAYTDELSLSGYLYPTHLLGELGKDPRRFFSSTSFTRSHDRSVDAVLRRLVDAAAVDSLVFDALVARDETLRDRIRIVHRSPSFGVMPIVASTRLSAQARARLRSVLLELHLDPASAAALGDVHIQRFVPPDPDLYVAAIGMARRGR